MRFLQFDRSDDGDGLITLEALASTGAAQHLEVMNEVQQVLDWAWRAFPDGHGPLADGHVWDHDLQVVVEDGDWHSVQLTLAGHPDFLAALALAFPEAAGDPSA